jgi:hypothetical protein
MKSIALIDFSQFTKWLGYINYAVSRPFKTSQGPSTGVALGGHANLPREECVAPQSTRRTIPATRNPSPKLRLVEL